MKQVFEKVQITVWVVSAFLILGIFGGIEQGTIADWKMVPAILLILIIDLALLGFTKERKTK